MNKLKYLLLMAILVACLGPGVAAYDDDEYAPTEDKENVEFFMGYQGSSLDQQLFRVAEFDVVDPNPLFGFGFWTSPFDATRLSFSLGRIDNDDASGRAELDLRRRVRINATLDSLFHRLDHDPLTNLQGVAEIKVVRSTDLEPGREYGIRHRQWNVDAEFQHPDVSWLQWRVGFREQQREGTRQILTTSHCTSCHTTAQGREVDQRTTDVVFGAHAAAGRFDLDYEFTGRRFEEQGLTPAAPFEEAFRPATPGTAPDPTVLIKPFNDRLWFQNGSFPVNDIPTVQRRIHQLKARIATGDSGKFNLTAVHARTENRDTRIDYDFDAYRARYTVRPKDNLRLSIFAQHDEIASDVIPVDLLALNGLASAPVTSYGGSILTYQAWRQAVDDPSLVFESLTRRSSLDRSDDRAGVDLLWRPKGHGSLRAGYKYRNVDRDNVILLDGTGETEKHQLKLAWNQRLAKKLRWNNSATYTSTDNPYASDLAALRTFAGFRDEPAGIVLGNASTPKSPDSLQYYQLHALRVAHLGNVATEQLRLRSAVNWSPSGRWALSANARYSDSENDELNFSTWEQNTTAVGVNLWMAASPRFHFTLGADHKMEETDAFVAIPLMDG